MAVLLSRPKAEFVGTTFNGFGISAAAERSVAGYLICGLEVQATNAASPIRESRLLEISVVFIGQWLWAFYKFLDRVVPDLIALIVHMQTVFNKNVPAQFSAIKHGMPDIHKGNFGQGFG